ncbi:MAG: gamma carbonic anhydrase family protein [Wenzhouxiangella sp.]|jgi:carbonic anhydrase/acetyltransferase-like protein (isoleucine patch superfamily)|nr:gamma carbonic anhydrase family protein [Wenzhouxiangella sp.]
MAALRPYLDHRPRLGERVYVDPDSTVIGRVTLGDDVSIWPRVVLRGDVNDITVGERTNIQDGTICHLTHDGRYSPGGIPLILGADITIGHGAILHACTVGDRCLVGMGAILLDGSVVASDVMIGAGSLVSPGKHLESGWLYRGRPATQARRLTTDEMAMLRYSAAHYVKLKDQYLASEV